MRDFTTSRKKKIQLENSQSSDRMNMEELGNSINLICKFCFSKLLPCMRALHISALPLIQPPD